jgi:hypothetical protein
MLQQEGPPKTAKKVYMDTYRWWKLKSTPSYLDEMNSSLAIGIRTCMTSAEASAYSVLNKLITNVGEWTRDTETYLATNPRCQPSQRLSQSPLHSFEASTPK